MLTTGAASTRSALTVVVRTAAGAVAASGSARCAGGDAVALLHTAGAAGRRSLFTTAALGSVASPRTVGIVHQRRVLTEIEPGAAAVVPPEQARC